MKRVFILTPEGLIRLDAGLIITDEDGMHRRIVSMHVRKATPEDVEEPGAYVNSYITTLELSEPLEPKRKPVLT